MPQRARSKSVTFLFSERMLSLSGRTVLILVLLGYLTAVSVRITHKGWTAGWSMLGVYSMDPPFRDLAAVLQSVDRYKAGTPVAEIQSQNDPLSMAYPPLWLWMLAPTGLGESDTMPVGVIIGAVTTAVAVLFLGRLTLAEGLFAALFLVSPSFMLGVERCNVDLVVFLVMMLALWMLALRSSTSLILAAAILMLAAFLKLYPIAALLAFFRKRHGVPLIILTVICFAAYCLLSLDDLRRIAANAGRDVFLSFGCMVLVDRFYAVSLSHGHALSKSWLELIGLATALATMAVTCFVTWRRRLQAPLTSHMAGIAFLAGSSIYIFCFLTGNHYAYRLWWLILILPQLLSWIRDGGPARRRALLTAGASLVAAYITSFTRRFGLSEVVNWALFSLLISLVTSALGPDVQDMLFRLRAVIEPHKDPT